MKPLAITGAAALLAGAAIVASTGCFRIKPACEGMSIDPVQWSTHIGGVRGFRASENCSFQVPAGLGVSVSMPPTPDSIHLVAQNTTGIFSIAVQSLADSSRRCFVTTNVIEFGYDFSSPVSIVATGGQTIVGSVAVGGPTPAPLAPSLLAGSTGRVYLGFFAGSPTSGVGAIRVFDLETMGGDGAQLLYTTEGVIDPGFSLNSTTFNPPSVAADAAANGYWIASRGNGTSSRIGVLRSTIAAGATPGRFVGTSNAPGTLTDLAVAGVGNVLLLSDTGAGGSFLSRVPDVFAPSPGVVALGPLAGIPVAIAVDPEGRVLAVDSCCSLRRYDISSGLPVLTDTFGMPRASAVDLSVSAEGVIYVSFAAAGGEPSQIQLFNERGELVDTILQAGDQGTLEDVQSAGVAPDGRLEIFDDVAGDAAILYDALPTPLY